VRLLLVEDDSKLVAMLRRGFSEEGFEVVSAGDGERGLELLRAGDFDGCVLDVLLPGRDGFAVLAAARAAGVATPILLLTARDAVPDRVHGLELGADDYLTKPFAFAELLARLNARMRRGAAGKPATRLRWGPLELDAVAHQVTLAGETIELSARQFALLEYLLRHQGEVVTRATLLDRVFGYAYDPGTNIVDVHVMHLRKRLGVAAASLVSSVRGVGYRVSDAPR
jgi:two-component system OmpR family response regulator